MALYDMYKNHFEAHIGLKQKLLTHSINDLSKLLDLEPEYIIYILLKFDETIDPIVESRIKEYYSKNHIDDNRAIVITDTHIGAHTEDIKLVACAYNYAYQNNINNIIHLGDLVQGNLDEHNIKIKEYDKQIEKAKEIFDYTPGLNTHVLLGNHDYYLPNDYYIYLKQLLDKLNNTKYLGRRYSYITLCDNDPIRLDHYIPCLCNELMPKLPVNLTLEGHHHQYAFEKYGIKNNIYLPQLSSIFALPGFFVLETTGNEFIIKNIRIDTKYCIKENNELVLKKSIIH